MSPWPSGSVRDLQAGDGRFGSLAGQSCGVVPLDKTLCPYNHYLDPIESDHLVGQRNLVCEQFCAPKQIAAGPYAPREVEMVHGETGTVHGRGMIV